MNATENAKPRPTTNDPKDWVVSCLDCDRAFKIAVDGMWPREPRCYECGSKRHMERMAR